MWPSTHQCTIEKIPFWDFMDGMKLSPRDQFTWSVVFFPGPFFVSCFFFPRSHSLFSCAIFLRLAFFFLSPHPWTQNFFLGTPTYPSNLPTSLPPPNPSTSPDLPHYPFVLPSITRASKPQTIWLVGFRVCASIAWREELVELGEWKGSNSNIGSSHNIMRREALKVSVFFSCFQNQDDKLHHIS